MDALSHPKFSAEPSPDGSDPAVEALTNALLDGTLPAGCEKLKRAMTGGETETTSPEEQRPEQVVPASPDQPVATSAVKVNKRQNIWDEIPMDFQRLKIENERREE